MLFNSYVFILLFLPITLAVFYLLALHVRRAEVAITWLVLASLFFYGWWNPLYLVLLLASMAFNYAVGTQLGRTVTETSSTRRAWLILGVSGNIGLLGYFKYANFFIDSVNVVFDSGWRLDEIVLPLAISFFTFQQIAYLVDAWAGKAHEYRLLHYCLFVTFFPQLIAGPIVHHKEMLPQFGDPKTFRPHWSNFAVGVTIFSVGLFKKVIIADNFAQVATPVFQAAEAGELLGFFEAWKGAFAYTFQLYFDFSGYSDMAIGLARLFGIRLPLNFNSPYQATNIIDFWRRWHMTLSRFLRDYLYVPLGGNRKGPARRHINLMITMLLGGLWHGAGWTFVMWGALHGGYLIVNYLWRYIWQWGRGTLVYQFTARCITLIAVIVGWVYFRAESFQGANQMLAAMTNLPNSLHGRIGPLEPMLSWFGFGFTGGYLVPEHLRWLAVLAFWLAIVWYWPNTQQWMARARPALDDHMVPFEQPFRQFWCVLEWRPGVIAGAVAGLVAVIALLGLSQITEFLYFQF